MSNVFTIALLIGFVAAAAIAPLVIPLLTKLKFGQSILEIGPKWHQKKSGTPTMGGIIFMLALIIAVVFCHKSMDSKAYLVLFCALGFGLIGFLDDFIKVVLKRNLGLRAWQKLALQIIVSIIFVIFGLEHGLFDMSIKIPFTSFEWEMGLLYIPFAIFVLLGTVNAVNLTDGVDGLATSLTIVTLLFFAVSTAISGETSLCTFSFALTGALMGFLLFNKNPAKVFMGDTGSLMLGGTVAALALMLKSPLIILLVGIVFFLETLSVIIQVTSFKLTGKRVFKMSPIHHHFEMCGWGEYKIVLIFCLVQIIFSIIGYFGIGV